MNSRKKVAFFIDSMGVGGAQRVISVLCKELVKTEYDVDLLMLYKRDVFCEIPECVNLYYVEDMPVKTVRGRLIRFLFEKWNYVRRRVYIPFLRRIGVKNYLKWNETSFFFYSQYALPYREYLLENGMPTTVFGFLIRSNIAMLMAARGLSIKTVFCERNNPVRSDIPHNIIRIRDRVYKYAKCGIFQTEEQRTYYPQLHNNSAVIPNPVKEGLPESYIGERRTEIVTFCRLTKQKNIPLLIDAFEQIQKDYSDYRLRIFGEGESKDNLIEYVEGKGMSSVVFFEEFDPDLHRKIRDAKMFVSTSDFEGLSNSMIEAMAIGLPCICTDCDGGGARMIIKDHVNGLLIPKGDVRAVYLAMKEVIDSPELAKKLSEEGIKIREQLSVQKIIDRWMEVIE